MLESPILKPDKIESNERAIPRRSASFEESVLEIRGEFCWLTHCIYNEGLI